jgi:hypothetical protein
MNVEVRNLEEYVAERGPFLTFTAHNGIKRLLAGRWKLELLAKKDS